MTNFFTYGIFFEAITPLLMERLHPELKFKLTPNLEGNYECILTVIKDKHRCVNSYTSDYLWDNFEDIIKNIKNKFEELK